MMSISHWGMFYWPALPQWHEDSTGWSYDSTYLHATYQHLNFGPYLS